MHIVSNTDEIKKLPEHYFPQESELYFDTYERPVYFAGKNSTNTNSMYQCDKFKAIVRMFEGTPKQIGMVGKNYKCLPTKDICHEAENEFCSVLTHNELKNVQVKDSISYFGGLCFREYIFPGIRADINSSKSDIAFRTIIVNGYDGSSTLKMYSGAIDFFCTNGMVSGVYSLVAKRHTSGLTVPKLTSGIKQSLVVFYEMADTYKKWVGKVIKDEDAKQCFEDIPGISDRRVEQFMHQFRIECLSHGRTVWALYSAITFYSSHSSGEFTIRETEQDHTVATLYGREQTVRRWIETDAFKKLAA